MACIGFQRHFVLKASVHLGVDGVSNDTFLHLKLCRPIWLTMSGQEVC